MPDSDWRATGTTPATATRSEGGFSAPYDHGINRSTSSSDPSTHFHDPRMRQHPGAHPWYHGDPHFQVPPLLPHAQSASSFDSSGGASAGGGGPPQQCFYPDPSQTLGLPSSGHPTGHGHVYPPPPPPPPPSSFFPPSFWGAASGGGLHHPMAYPSQYPHQLHPLLPPHAHPYESPSHGGPSRPPPHHGLMLPPLLHAPVQAHAMTHHPHYHPTAAPIQEYITEIHPQDVLSGRGGATNSHSGNRTFRALVKEHQERYLKAKKRDKPAVAARIVELVRKRGGRFLRRIEDPSKASSSGFGLGYVPDPNRMPLYVDIGDDRAMEKTCQALREGAPEIRRKKNRPGGDSHSDESTDPKSPASRQDSSSLKADSHSPSRPSLAVALSATSTSSLSFDMNVGNANSSMSDRRTATDESRGGEPREMDSTRKRSYDSPRVGRELQHRFVGSSYASERLVDGPIMIRPFAKLMPGRPAVPPYPIDNLSAEDRDLYLAFLPPYPSIRTKRTKIGSAGHDVGSGHDGDDAEHHVDDDDRGSDDHHHHHTHRPSASVPNVLPIVRV